MEGIAQCKRAIGSDNHFNEAVLVESGWRRMRTYQDAQREFRTEYWHGNLVNEILYLDKLDGCFTKAKVANIQQLLEIRQHLIDTYDLVTFDEYKGLDDFKSTMLARFGNEMRKNLLFADDQVFVMDVTEHKTGLYLSVSNSPTRT